MDPKLNIRFQTLSGKRKRGVMAAVLVTHICSESSLYPRTTFLVAQRLYVRKWDAPTAMKSRGEIFIRKQRNAMEKSIVNERDRSSLEPQPTLLTLSSIFCLNCTQGKLGENHGSSVKRGCLEKSGCPATFYKLEFQSALEDVSGGSREGWNDRNQRVFRS